MGAVWAETPDRIWIAQRGELPLPKGAKPWTPYGMLQPPRVATGNDDGTNATCDPEPKRGWERRYHHSIFVVNREGKVVEWWSDKDKEKLFEMRCGRGPHKIKMSPYDPEKHVWIIDDQLHMIYKFTHDGKLVMSWGTKGQKGRDAGKLFDRPTDVAWLPDGTFFISDGYGGTRVAKFDKDGKFIKDWGKAQGSQQPRPQRVEYRSQHRSARTASSTSSIAATDGCRCSTEGKFLEMWTTGVNSSPYYHFITTDQNIWIGDGDEQNPHTTWMGTICTAGALAPRSEEASDRSTSGPHQLTTDQDGNLRPKFSLAA